ncbi:hypothetical protein DUI87_09542 [Hirundo rustica rustica]|uniref:Uncharacterized protein n=1 Tax=Hirundo rustica rustica TaxID=333673 RepID=A0A3M0KMX9_HIRRU|nr:hypothetical protein DUI87_09542 [Hirundo rustica rustica]
MSFIQFLDVTNQLFLVQASHVSLFRYEEDDASSGKDSQVPEGSNGEYEDHSGKQWGFCQGDIQGCVNGIWFQHIAHSLE